MKLILLTINVILLALNVISQEYPETDKSVISKEQEIYYVLQQGRDKIIKDIIAGNHETALSTLEQLRKNYGDHYVILYPREEVMVSLATRDFETLADSALHYNIVIPKNKKAFIFNDFRNELRKYLSLEIASISQDLEKSDLSKKEKEIINIYIHFLFGNSTTILNKEIRDFKKNHSKTLYSNFLNSITRTTINSRINFSLGYSGDLIGGKVSDSYFSWLNATKIELDGFIKQTYISLYLSGGFSNLRNARSFHDENDRVFILKGEKIHNQKYGLKLGRIIYSSDKIKIYPYLSAGGVEYTPPTILFQNSDVFPNNIIKVSSFYTGIGSSCDILLKKWKPKDMYDPEGYFFIRPSIGYDRLFSETKISNTNNLYFSVSLGVGIGPKK